MVMAEWAKDFRLNVPIWAQRPSEEKHYLRVSSRSPQGDTRSTYPKALVCIPLEDEQPPKFDIIPMQAPQATKEEQARQKERGYEDMDWDRYIYVVSPVARPNHARSYLGHPKTKPGTPSNRKDPLCVWRWSHDEAAGNTGWILYRSLDRKGFHLMRTLDMGKTASSGARINHKDVEVLMLADFKLPQKYECGRRREIGGSDGIVSEKLQTGKWRKVPFYNN